MPTYQRPSSVLLRGGSIYAPHPSHATAMFTVRGSIAWIGDDAAAERYVEDADVVVDLQGRLVTSGFVDAHAHLASTGFALQSVDLSTATSLEHMLDLLSGYADRLEAQVLVAQGWDETNWPEKRTPTAAEIDRAVGAKPAYIARVDSHSAVISSALLRRIPRLTELEGWRGDGRVERDAHHGARKAADDLRTESDRRQALRLALEHAASLGVTSIHELNAPHIAPFDDFALIKELRVLYRLPEVVGYWGEFLGGAGGVGGSGGVDVDEQLAGYAGDLCMDGAIGSRTAALAERYADADSTGHLYLDAASVRQHVVWCTQQHLQAGFHVIGDRAMHTVVAGFQAAAEVVGVDALVAARHRLEHVEMPDDDGISCMARLGIVASVQPAFDAAWGAPGQLYDQRLGWTRAEPMNPFATMQSAGVALAFGSDSPITPIDPWAAVRAAAYHHRDSERLTVSSAFDAHTRGGHRARRYDEGGVLAPGAHATYAIWDVDAELGVQTPGHRGAGWSTNARAGVAVLPDLHPDVALPTCMETVVGGVRLYAAESAT
ncbi:MAG: amidohydrolase family protein [Nocardioidaceae bacterium]